MSRQAFPAVALGWEFLPAISTDRLFLHQGYEQNVKQTAKLYNGSRGSWTDFWKQRENAQLLPGLLRWGWGVIVQMNWHFLGKSALSCCLFQVPHVLPFLVKISSLHKPRVFLHLLYLAISETNISILLKSPLHFLTWCSVLLSLVNPCRILNYSLELWKGKEIYFYW